MRWLLYNINTIIGNIECFGVSGECEFVDEPHSLCYHGCIQPQRELSLFVGDMANATLDLRLRLGEEDALGTEDVMCWILNRIVTKTQEGIMPRLQSLDIPDYDPWFILQNVQGISMNDPAWVQFDPNATFKSTHSWRMRDEVVIE